MRRRFPQFFSIYPIEAVLLYLAIFYALVKTGVFGSRVTEWSFDDRFWVGLRWFRSIYGHINFETLRLEILFKAVWLHCSLRSIVRRDIRVLHYEKHWHTMSN